MSKCTRPCHKTKCNLTGNAVLEELVWCHTPGKDGEAALRRSNRSARPISAACTGREGRAAIGDRGSCS